MAIVTRGMTLEEFLALPEHKPALEYFNGMVTQKPMSMGERAALQGCFIEYLNPLLRPGTIGLALPELRETVEGASLMPDVSVFKWEWIPRTPTGRIESRFVTPPDIAIEIRSPGQTIRELSTKCAWFVAHGAQVARLVDHRDETIREFRPDQPVRTMPSGDAVRLDELAPGTAIPVAEIFAALQID